MFLLQIFLLTILSLFSTHAISPFDDLSASEIKTVVSLARSSGLFLQDAEFPIIRMEEPSKSDWMSGQASNHRFAYAAIFESSLNRLTEVVVDLRENRIKTIQVLDEGIAPPILLSEFMEVRALIYADERWKDAIKRRGLDMKSVDIHPWFSGTKLESEMGPSRRIMRGVAWSMPPEYQGGSFENRAANNFRDFLHTRNGSNSFFNGPIEGLTATVDLVSKTVLSVWDEEMVNMTSTTEAGGDYTAKPYLKPLHIQQPDGSSIVANGQELKWYKWRIRYSVDPIHGLQLYHVTYNGDCAERSVLYKMSMGEMFVPYGAKGKSWRWRHAFDAGEFGIGRNVVPLTRGMDVPENAILFNCTNNGPNGETYIIEGCVGAFERDVGVIFKHHSWNFGEETGSPSSDERRGRQLVLTLMATIGNYDYAFDYIFHMDGVIEVKVRLTGIVLMKGVQMERNREDCLTDCESLINDYLIGPPHQHFFNYRIDMDVDGVKNYVAQVDVTPDYPQGPNPLPWDQGMFSPKKTLLRTEQFSDHNLHHHRSWHVLNANSRNDFNSPRGYALKPGSAIGFTYLTLESPVLRRAKFVQHPFWVSKFKDNEQQPLDKFPRTAREGEGLPKFINDQESVEDTDAVIWYTFGVTHTTRAEEWPIMNVHHALGFSLVPYNFMSQNSEMSLKDKCP